MSARRLQLLAATVILAFAVATGNSASLEVRRPADGLPYIAYGDQPALGYGPSPQALFVYLPSGNGNNAREWLAWAKQHGITNVRSYPPSIVVEAPAENLFERSSQDPDKFDLTRFNPRYFRELRQICQQFRDNGIFVHLQFWQAVAWKKTWESNYYNPANNVSAGISRHAGPGEFVTLENPLLLQHQKQYIELLLDATADLGNVFFDIMNEIGNGTGSDGRWVMEIVRHIRDWEAASGVPVLLTVTDPSVRLSMADQINGVLDILVQDFGRHDQHLATQAGYGRPTVSVRNIDWHFATETPRYFFAWYNLELNRDRGLQARGRKYWWRMFMSRVQMAAGYADSYKFRHLSGWRKLRERLLRLFDTDDSWRAERSSFALNLDAEVNFAHFMRFASSIEGYEQLAPVADVMPQHAAPHTYGLMSGTQAIVYLESATGTAGTRFAAQPAVLEQLQLPDGLYEGYFYVPATGQSSRHSFEVRGGRSEVQVPAFTDDLGLHINASPPGSE